MVNMTFRADDHTPEEGQWRTFDEWRELGYGVYKGEKSRRRINGVCVFHESQVGELVTSADENPYCDMADIIGIACWSPEWWKD